MAFAELKIFSEALGISTEAYVIIPQRSTSGQIGIDQINVRGKYPCLYLLHGLSDDHTTWSRRTSIERYASKYGIAVVMPKGDKSFYTDMKHGDKYYTYISEELPRITTDLFPVSSEREDNIIGGLSMGGYGALKIALRNPTKFKGAIALSPVSDIHHFFDIAPDTLSRVFGSREMISREDDIFTLATDVKSNSPLPSLFVAVGRDDFMYDDTLRLSNHLSNCGYDITYREADGGHSWDFWDEYIAHALKWAYSN